MGKKWGKRGKNAGRGSAQIDPFAMQARPPAPRHAPPASSTPLSDYLRREQPGVTDGYVVLPRALVEDMPLPWQQQLVNLLAQFHDGHARLDWPAYRVVPSRPERLVDLDEEQLAEAGYLVEIDSEGEMVYRERSGRKVDDPDSVTVLVSCLDPVVQGSRPRTAPAVPQQGKAAPMNIGPQPVWETPPSGFVAPSAGTAAAPGSTPPGSAGQGSAPTAESGTPTPPSGTAVPASPAGQPQPAQPPQSPPQPSQPSQQVPPAAGPVTASGSFPAVPPPGAAQPDAARSDAAQRDWFDEMPADGAGASAAEGADGDGAVFGPTGAEPTEIPYRFRR
ncbi:MULTISPECIES: hypothetical protein [Prauserella salsuginis group]|uniref:Uncharacterized protein n=1 Tax=Prauserella salsuginis TaxID=387889 RepID=A0ABW6G6E5_9PSEU|nr:MULTISPECIES: hypothetical protein [Prauserella salsuginis group]MCR3722843.1 hypothetical protein [Prauserella flava]MCR3737102.1 hypothetical protein [Prauserella salsuginis]